MATSGQVEAPDYESSDESPKRPERVFRVGNVWATVWCNELRQDVGSNKQTTRFVRSVRLERRFWNAKLKDGDGDYDSSSSYSLGDVHNAIAALELATDYLKKMEADVTRDKHAA